MAGSAAAYALPKQSSFAAFALDVGPSTFRPVLNRREAKNLFAIDAAKSGRDSVWEAYFVEQIVEFVVHGRRPTGIVTEEDAAWLVAQFGPEPSPAIPALLRGIVAEAESIPAAIIGYALSCGAMRV